MLALVALAALVAGLVSGGGGDTEGDGRTLEITAGEKTVLRVDLAGAASPADVRGRLSDADRSLRRALVVRRGAATIRYRLDRERALAAAAGLGEGGGRAEVAAQPVSASIDAPVVAQKLRNNCETASLQTLLATRGVEAEQLDLQAQLPRSGPPDPVDEGGTRVWGDPELGYVGRPEGGGVAGGFGVYQQPVMGVAARRGVKLRDMTGEPIETVRERILEGHAVMVWIALAPGGPYGEWQSPEGKPIRVTFNEHTLVLNGVRPNGDFEVVNPLEGTREVWSESRVEAARELLERRALST